MKALNTTATLCHDTPRNRSSGLVALTITFGITPPLFVIVRLAFRLLTHPSGRLGEQTRTGETVNMYAWTPAAITIALDFWIMAIPLWQLQKLNMDFKKKMAVGLMLCVGVFDIVISIIRLTFLLPSKLSANATQGFYPIILWSAVEYHVAVICACLPAMRQLLIRAFPRLDSAPGGSNDGCAGDGGGAGAKRNVPRSGTHRPRWPGQQGGGTGRRRGPWSRQIPTETESERDIVLGSVRRSTGGNAVEVMEVVDVEQQPADVRILNSTEKREGFGLSIVGRWKENGGHANHEVFPLNDNTIHEKEKSLLEITLSLSQNCSVSKAMMEERLD
ncbi:hypothetical protein SMACR_06305 [Sordaria macrospora]|uniref:WGS project CABT00000000 data, contig 2.34 n=2 Tax=Sordaria macrospora TaxID=5147 RepID=F7W6E8_SORMK|nr:uncharacterized protein SMAC_06305 [Sordaria macrospora k-hell]KAA8624067.1 hypothetical protein SMACR_06305 [Sordaria macrospora]WPJ61924.1 hypothetical protein SMAC4_06305 [Sordaria macrospora]CCC13087.1 unnamed protein product [Sordaria macrospora k-hell]